MKYKSYIYIPMLLCIALSSCEFESSNSVKETSSPEEKETNVLEVKEAGYDLQLSLTEQELTNDVVFEFDRTFGHVQFSIDENFDFILTQEETELSEIKKELETDALFSYKFHNHSDNELFYQSVLPDGTEMGYNLIRKTIVKGKNYIYKSNSHLEFSKEDIKRAQLILNKIS